MSLVVEEQPHTVASSSGRSANTLAVRSTINCHIKCLDLVIEKINIWNSKPINRALRDVF